MRYRLLAVFSLIVLVLTACGGDDDASTADPSGPDPTSADAPGPDGDSDDDGAVPDLPASGGSGTMTVDGDSIEVTGVFRCIPFDASEFGGAAGDPNEIDLVIFGGSGGLSLNHSTTEDFDRTLQGEAYNKEIHELRLNQGGTQFENIAGTLPDGSWILGGLPFFGDPGDGTPIDGPPFIVEGNNISGAMTLVQTFPEGANGTAEVTFDVSFPSEEQDCST